MSAWQHRRRPTAAAALAAALSIAVLGCTSGHPRNRGTAGDREPHRGLFRDYGCGT